MAKIAVWSPAFDGLRAVGAGVLAPVLPRFTHPTCLMGTCGQGGPIADRRMGEARGGTAKECGCRTRATHRTVVCAMAKIVVWSPAFDGLRAVGVGVLAPAMPRFTHPTCLMGTCGQGWPIADRRMGEARGGTAKECGCRTRATHRTVVVPWRKLPGGHRRLMGCARSGLRFLPRPCRASPILRALWGPVVRVGRSLIVGWVKREDGWQKNADAERAQPIGRWLCHGENCRAVTGV